MPARTFHLGLIGYPLDHSLSPRIHRAALRSVQLGGEYRLFPIPELPRDEQLLLELLERLRRGSLHGLNVTIPHKQAVMAYLDELTPAARQIGAVNTIYVRRGLLIGDNTDAAGFLVDLFACFPELAPPRETELQPPAASEPRPTGSQQRNPQRIGNAGWSRALVLGAGGAARAVAFALLQSGWQVGVAARRAEQAQSLISDLGHGVGPAAQQSMSRYPMPVRPQDLKDLEPQLIVNATPVGMAPHIHTCPWPQQVPFPDGARVYDLVYNPVETKLVRQARAAGLPAVTGHGMLIEQAMLAFQRWTGQVLAPEAKQQLATSIQALQASR